MKFRKSASGIAPYILLAVIAVQAVTAGYLGHLKSCIAGLILTAVSTAYVIIYNFTKQRRMKLFIENIAAQVLPGAAVITHLDIPIMAVTDNEITWYNSAFRKQVLSGHDCLGHSPDFLVSDELLNNSYGDGTNLDYKGKAYRFYSCNAGGGVIICFFVDRTDTVKFKELYRAGRPAAVYITVDNIDELQTGARDSEKAQITTQIEKVIENWASELNAICRKISSDRFLLVTDETGLKYMTATHFRILNDVRAIDFGDKGKATLSIGVGHCADNLSACDDLSRQALDMALSRGGDQAAVYDGKEYSFFGGTSATMSKRSKVRTRMIASALRELIYSAENVVIMGHRFADFDSFGSCFGMYRAVTKLGKPAKIVIQRDKCMCGQLVDYVCKAYPDEKIIASLSEIMPQVTRRTLLIVTDTHRKAFLDCPEIADAAGRIAVIDHHRKTVDFIDNAVIFYHEPYASSTCEMVSELLQYMSVNVSRTESEALLAGIMLDTRNFVLNTGVRTFEASAWLRGCGANTVTVKGFFQNSIEVYRERSSIVSSAQVYGRCAISYTDNRSDCVRIAASQAADDMLGIENVDASFVAFMTGNVVNISGRSLGGVNVQLIMEQLGGGGHLTMAACQLQGITMRDALHKLTEAINSYERNNK